MSTLVYPDKIMRGNTYVRKTVGKFLYEKMPQNIELMRSQYDDLDGYKLPFPKQYDAMDPYGSGTHKYPIVGAYFPGTDNFVRTSILPSGASLFDGMYEATLFVAASTAILPADKAGIKRWEKPERDSAMRIRDDLMACMRAAILETPSCGTAGQFNRIVISQSSIKESYQEPIQPSEKNPGMWVAVGLINVNIDVVESTSVSILGTANTFDVQVETLF